MKNGVIYVYERYCMLNLIEDVFIVLITFKKSNYAIHKVTKLKKRRNFYWNYTFLNFFPNFHPNMAQEYDKNGAIFLHNVYDSLINGATWNHGSKPIKHTLNHV